MADYAKKTVAELHTELKGRGLTSSGKKAELIARLQDADKEVGTTADDQASTTVAPTSKPSPEATTSATEIKQPNKKDNTSSIPTITTTSASTESSAPVDAPAKSPSQPPQAQPQDARESSATTDAKLATAVAYSMNLPTSTVDDEMKKRKARAERFGVPAKTPAAEAVVNGSSDPAAPPAEPKVDADTIKNLERAKRFGAVTSENTMGKLDQALPQERERGGRKRGREGGDDTASAGAGVYDDPGLRNGRGRGGGGKRFRGRGTQRGTTAPERPRSDKPSGGNNAFSSEKDRLAAEARRKKFQSGT